MRRFRPGYQKLEPPQLEPQLELLQLDPQLELLQLEPPPELLLRVTVRWSITSLPYTFNTSGSSFKLIVSLLSAFFKANLRMLDDVMTATRYEISAPSISAITPLLRYIIGLGTAGLGSSVLT